MQGFDAGLGGFESGDDAFFEKAGDEEFHLELRGVTGLAGAVGLFFHHGSEGLELAESLAGGALADVQTPQDVLHAERLLAGKKQTIDLSVGLGVAEEFGQVGENGDEAFLVGCGNRWGVRGGRTGAAGAGHGGGGHWHGSNFGGMP